MSRKGPAKKRIVAIDPIYKSVLIAKLTNQVLQDGKKSIAQDVVYKAIDIAGEKEDRKGIDILNKAIENIKPLLEVRSRRVGGATYQVPVSVSQLRGQVLALRWLVNYSRVRREHTMSERLAAEIVDASKGLGAAIKKREDTHKMAESNRAFAHFRW
jgi:small subunit ribosomal protein S7